MKRYSLIYIFLPFIYFSISGCTTIAVVPDLPCPARPTLTAISNETQLLIYPDKFVEIVYEYSNDIEFIKEIYGAAQEQESAAKEIINADSQNQIALKSYSKKLETRAGCEM